MNIKQIKSLFQKLLRTMLIYHKKYGDYYVVGLLNTAINFPGFNIGVLYLKVNLKSDNLAYCIDLAFEI